MRRCLRSFWSRTCARMRVSVKHTRLEYSAFANCTFQIPCSIRLWIPRANTMSPVRTRSPESKQTRNPTKHAPNSHISIPSQHIAPTLPHVPAFTDTNTTNHPSPADPHHLEHVDYPLPPCCPPLSTIPAPAQSAIPALYVDTAAPSPSGCVLLVSRESGGQRQGR